MLELHDIAWMRLQWKRFKRLLGGATGMVWLLFSSGVLFLPEEEEGETWFWARISLLVCLFISTVVSLWLYIAARRRTTGNQAVGAGECRHLSRRSQGSKTASSVSFAMSVSPFDR